MNDELIKESASDYGYFEKLRGNVGYAPSRSLTDDWTRGAARSLADESSASDDDFFNSYPFFMFNADARTTFMINMNEGQLMDDKDRMIAATRDKERVESLLNIISNKDIDNDSLQNIIASNADYNSLLKDGKFDSSDIWENMNKLEDIRNKAIRDYDDAFEDYQTDLKDIEDWKNSHEVSSYYTRKSEQTSKLGNWFYTQPATQGLSSSSWKEQAASLAAGIGSSLALMKAGAAVGSVGGPLGTIAGGISGLVAGIGGAIIGQVVGGAKAREQESHMEAYSAYKDRLLDIMADKNLNVHDIANNFREQAKELGYPDLSDITDDEIVGMAAADTRFKYNFTGGYELAQAMDDAFTGTRRVYERNNALGAGEFFTDVISYTPLKPLTLAKGAGKYIGAGTKIGEATNKLNPLSYLQDVTMKTNLDISKLAGKMRLKALKHYGAGTLKRVGLNFIEEGTEEGAQGIIQKEFMEGKYDEERAEDSFIDAITSGNVLSDMFDNLLFRTESGLSFLGLNSKYKNDLQLQEEMWAGGLLSLLSPQSAAVSAKNFYETYKGVERAYGMGKFIEESLSKNADINGIETFFRNMRKYDFVNSSDYEQTLNYLRDELKSAKTSKDGKTTRRWKIDTDALYKIIGPVNRNLKDANGDPIKPQTGELTDEAIDEFIDMQAETAKTLFAYKKNILDPSWKRISGDFAQVSPIKGHTMEELNNISKQISDIQKQLEDEYIGDNTRKNLNNKLKELKRNYKRYSKSAVDTDMQDAYYAITTMGQYEKNNAENQKNLFDKLSLNTQQAIRSNVTDEHFTKIKRSLGLPQEVPNDLLFSILWSNQHMYNLRMARAQQESTFLAAQREALQGNSPLSLTENQQKVLEAFDQLIEVNEKQHNELIDSLGQLDLEQQVKLKELADYGNSTAAEFAALDEQTKHDKGIGTVFTNSGMSPEDMQRYVVARDNGIMSKLTAIQAEKDLDELLHGKPEKIKELIKQYRKAKHESFESQQSFEKSQNTGTELNQEKYSSVRKWLAKATEQQIGERLDEIDENLTKNINRFEAFVASLDKGSELYQQLNTALQYANNIQEAANGSKQSKVRALQYQLQSIRKMFEGSNNPQMQQALDMVNNLLTDVINTNIINDEAQARQFKYNIPGKFLSKSGKPLKTDNKTFTDDEGNLYTVDLSKSTYSENNGLELVLNVKKDGSALDKERLQINLRALQNQLKAYQNDIDKIDPNESDINLSVYTSLYNMIENTQDLINKTKQALDNIDVASVLNVKYGDELLDKLYYQNNDGTKVTLNESYKITNEVLKERAVAERSRRLSNPGISAVQYKNVLRITSDQIRKEIGDLEAENEESEIKRAIAYSLGDTNNKKATSVLSSPYYQAKWWSGFFSYSMDETKVDSWGTVSEQRKNAIKRSIKLFNKLVKQAAHAKSIGKKDILQKFLEDADAILQKPINEQSPTDTITLESSDPAKPEYAVEVTRTQLMEIIRFLPMQAYLSNPRYGKGDKAGKLYVPLVLADLKDDSNAYSQDGKFTTKFQWRYAMVKSFLQHAHNRKKDGEPAITEEEKMDAQDESMQFNTQDGFDDTAEKENQRNRKQKPYASTIHIERGGVEITFEKYNQKFENPQFNPESPVFYDVNGKRLAQLPESDVLTVEELTEMYTEQVQKAFSLPNSEQIYTSFAEQLSDILGKEVTVEQLKQKHKQDGKDTNLTILEKIVLDGIRYGDGLILRDSFAAGSIANTTVFGPINYTSTSTKLQSVEKSNRVDRLFALIQDEFPNLFLSYKNENISRGTKQIVSPQQVAQYIDSGRFHKPGDRKTGKPGSVRVLIKDEDGEFRTLGNPNNPVKMSNQRIAELLNKLDEGIDAVTTPQQFFENLVNPDQIKFEFTPNPNVTLTAEEREAAAMNLISRYIRNRNFGRLKNVSSFTDMLMDGTDHPNNGPIANKRFFAKSGKVINSNLNDIDCLHIKEVNGVYYFDLADFASKSVRTQDVDEEGNVINAITDLEAEQELIQRNKKQVLDGLYDVYKEVINNKSDIKILIDYLNSQYDIFKNYEAFKDLYDEYGKIHFKDENGEEVTERNKVLDAVDIIYGKLKDEFDKMLENVAGQLTETLKEQASAEEKQQFEEDGRHSRVQFAVGSYNESTGKARLLRGDGSGNFVAVNEAVGQPGGVYLIVPSFMNSSGKRRIVHLNGRKLAIHQATFIAKILDAVRTGELSYNGNIPSNIVPGYRITTDGTVSQLLESIIHIGTEGIENDSSSSAFANLLFVDNSGQIHFGSKTLDDTNISELIQFLQDRKQIRVDRAKLLNDNANVGLSAKIELTDDSEFKRSGLVKESYVFELDAEENYQHYVISKGVVRSDINPDKGARMYSNVIVALDNPFTGNDSIPNPSNPKNSNSAASARAAATESFIPVGQFSQQINQPQQAVEQPQIVTQQVTQKIDYTVDSLSNFIIQEAAKNGLSDVTNGYDIYSVNGSRQFTQEELLSLLKQMQSETKADGTPYKAYNINVVDNTGKTVKVRIPLTQEVAQQVTIQPAQQQVQQQIAQVSQTPVPFAAPQIAAPAAPASPIQLQGAPVSAAPDIVPAAVSQSVKPAASPINLSQGTTPTATTPTVAATVTPVTSAPIAPASNLNEVEKIVASLLNNLNYFKLATSNITEDMDYIRSVILEYGKNHGMITDLGKFTQDLYKANLADLFYKYKEWRRSNPLYGKAVQFLDNHVEKEDYKAAQARAIRILGNPEIQFTSDISFTFDTNRRAYVYVFGQCCESFMRIYKSANGQVAAGVMDHEAFHRISLFVLSEKERKQLYSDIRSTYPETADMTNQQVEEFAADLFKDFVNKYSNQGIDGFYSNNKFVKFFQKVYDTGSKMIRKIFGLRTHPNYRGIDKLFQDMYSGRYAYAKATKNNFKLFRMIFRTAPMSGITDSKGTIIARTITERNQILRTLLDKVVNNSKLLDTVHNYTDIDAALDGIRGELQADYNGLSQRIMEAFERNDFDNVIRFNNLKTIYDTILTDEAWKAWKGIINDTLRRQFKISNQKKDPNQLLSTLEDNETQEINEGVDQNTEDTEELTSDEDPELADEESLNLGFSEERDSLQRNMWNSAALSVKILFYTITSEDSRNNKYNSNGMFNYDNPGQLYIRFTELLQDCISEKEMMSVLEQNKDQVDVAAILERLTQDEDPQVNKSLQNKFFVSVCRYQHSFENNVYDVTEAERDKDGNIVKPQVINARSTSGNVNEVTTKARAVIVRSIMEALADRSREYDVEKNKYNGSEEKKAIEKAISQLSNITIDVNKFKERLTDLLKKMYQVDGFGMFVEGDQELKQSVDMLMRFLVENDRISKAQVDTLKNVLNLINTSFTNLTVKDILSEQDSIKQKVQKVIDNNVQVQNFLKNLGKYSPRQQKSMSQNGPKNVRIYTIGAFNYISRLFKLWTKPHYNSDSKEREATEWKNYQMKSPYAEHSLWLHSKQLKDSKMNTRLQTMSEGDYANSKSDKFAFAKEEYINRMVTVLEMDGNGKWLGNHAFPVLANKKFSADLQGVVIEALEQPISFIKSASGTNMIVNEGAKKIFAGYFLDEVNAIKQAKDTRDKFISRLNEILSANYTVESFSNLSVSQQRELFNATILPENLREDAIQMLNNELNKLTVTYHFKSSKNEAVKDSKDRVVSFDDAHIDLRKGAGYKHRHFQKVADKLNERGIDINTLTVDNADLLNIVANEVLLPNIAFAKSDMKLNKAYDVIPNNLISGFKKTYKTLNDDQIKDAMIATFVIRHMSDILEYEKLVQGDMAYYGAGGKSYRKTIDKMTKRYSGPVSTFGLNASSGTQKHQLSVDERRDLTESSTYNTLTIQTTKLIDYDVYEGLVRKTLGIDVAIDYDVNLEDAEVNAKIDYKQLLDADGKIKQEVFNGVFAPYKNFLENYGDEIVAQAIVKDVLNRYAGYLSQDYTDATTWISPSMFRELRQRSDDGWNQTEEACYIFMEHYDELYKFYNNREAYPNDWQVIKNSAKVLGISDAELEGFVHDSRILYGDYQYNTEDKWNSPVHRELREKYRGKILSYLENEDGTPKIDTTALKYIHYGNRPQGGILSREDKLYIPVYDKTALAPLFKIFTEDHEAEYMYKLMLDRNIHVLKLDSSTKSGGMFGYQLYDHEGKFNQSLYNAPSSLQWFDQLLKQLDTDMHTHDDASLLTQLTKVVMLNTVGHSYDFGNQLVSGENLNKLYSQVFNSLTKEGFNKFLSQYGFKPDGSLDKEGRQTLVKKLREVLEESGAAQSTIDAFQLDADGNFITNPALLPSVNQMQTRLLSQVGKIIVDTHIKGIPLYQIVSAGFDQDHPLKKGVSFDKELLSPGEYDENGKLVTRMQARISIMLFNDVINKAKKNKALSAKYNDFKSFTDKRRFILDNKDKLNSLAYRVPTQGQNSTMAIEIVDVLPSTQGGIIQLPTTLTALTGADFDIDKLFTATYNYTVTDRGIERVNYREKYSNIEDLIEHIDELSLEQRENLLLDIYQTVLTSENNMLHTTTPLDVCTAPIKRVMTKEMKDNSEKNNSDGFSLNPAHQVQMRVQNSGSDSTIGPMALNSVFQYFTQTCDLNFINDPQLEKIGITGFGMEYIRTKESDDKGLPIINVAYILDTTSAMINAAVDAAKDNYIGRSNINAETFDVVSMLIAGGFGNNSFRFLAQPGVKSYVESLLNDSKEAIFRVKAIKEEVSKFEIRPELFTTEALKNNLNGHDGEAQEHYIKAYAYLKSIAQRYRQAITVAQVDTKKYGKNSTELMGFLQNVDDFNSVYNLMFESPYNLFEQSFLKEKLNSVRTAMDMFGNIFLENSQTFKQASDKLCTTFNKKGQFSKQFLRRAVPKLKQVVLKGFFDQYVINEFANPDGTINTKPLYTLFCDKQRSVIARYDRIEQLCMQEGIGVDFFDMIKHAPIRKKSNAPMFFIVNNMVTNDPVVKQAVTDSIAEMFHSSNPEVRKWITDAAVMQFYQTGGTDASFGTAVRTTFYDALPIRELANIEAYVDGSKITLNEYIAQDRYANDIDGLVNQAILQLSISDDEYIKTFKTYGAGSNFGLMLSGDGSVAVFKKYAFKARTDMRGARYAKYVKIKTSRTSTPALYVLGNVSQSYDEKTGKTYYNPVYYRMSKLGYQQYSNNSSRIRVDGAYYDNNLISLFNTDFLAKRKDNKKYSLFNATNYSQLNDFVVQDELNARKGMIGQNMLDVDELGNVTFPIADDPYLGMFDANPKNTNMVLSRLEQSPTQFNMDFVQRAKEVGATFQQLVKKGDEYKFIGSNKELSGVVSLLANSMDDVQQAAEFIFKTYPQVTMVKYIGPAGMDIISRGSVESTKSSSIVLSKVPYDRHIAEANPRTLYIFTDNLDRTSGGSEYGNSWYKEKYGKGGFGSYINPTTAILRGLPNAAPISTMKYYKYAHPGMNLNEARFNDSDFQEVQEVLQDEIKDIIDLWNSGNFDRVVIPNYDFLTDSSISEITEERTPDLYRLMKDTLQYLKQSINNDGTTKLLQQIEQNKNSEEQSNKKC